MAGEHQNLRDGRQLAFFFQPFENVFELGHEDDDQHVQDDEADDRQKDRVGHGPDDLALEVFLLFGEVGDAFEHILEETAFLSGANHADGEFAECLGVRRHGVGQSGAVGDLGLHLADDLAQGRGRGLSLENVHAANSGTPERNRSESWV